MRSDGGNCCTDDRRKCDIEMFVSRSGLLETHLVYPQEALFVTGNWRS